MSLPKIEPSKTSRCQAISDIIESVALEQTALSHILNAEGEKLQKIIGLCAVSPQLILETNRSVRQTLDSVSRLELILQSKLALFDDCLCHCIPEKNDCDCLG